MLCVQAREGGRGISQSDASHVALCCWYMELELNWKLLIWAMLLPFSAIASSKEFSCHLSSEKKGVLMYFFWKILLLSFSLYVVGCCPRCVLIILCYADKEQLSSGKDAVYKVCFYTGHWFEQDWHEEKMQSRNQHLPSLDARDSWWSWTNSNLYKIRESRKTKLFSRQANREVQIPILLSLLRTT